MQSAADIIPWASILWAAACGATVMLVVAALLAMEG
jgi:hypothetical protein